MDMTRGNQSPLFANAARTDAPELIGDALVADGDQHHGADPLTGWIGRLSIGEYLSGVMAAGQARAEELLGATRRLHASARAGATALHNYGRSVARSTSRTFNKAGSMIRNAPEAAVDYFCIALMGGLALMGATDWDTRRDRLERYTLLPGEQPHYWGTPRYTQQPYNSPRTVTFGTTWQPAQPHETRHPNVAPTVGISSAAYRQYNGAKGAADGVPEWLSPLLQQHREETRAAVTKEQADLATQYLAQFTGASSDIHTAFRRHSPTPPAQRIESVRDRREESARRVIRVRFGLITMAFSGPANDIYGQVGAWQELHPGSNIISDEPVLV